MAAVPVLKPFCLRACSRMFLMKPATRRIIGESGAYSSVSSMHKSRKMNSKISSLSSTLRAYGNLTESPLAASLSLASASIYSEFNESSNSASHYILCKLRPSPIAGGCNRVSYSFRAEACYSSFVLTIG